MKNFFPAPRHLTRLRPLALLLALLALLLAGRAARADQGQGLTISGQPGYAVGLVVPTATFGSVAIAQHMSGTTLALARLTNATLALLPGELTQLTATLAGPSAVRLA
jgi:hypothetical protein